MKESNSISDILTTIIVIVGCWLFTMTKTLKHKK